MKKSIFLFSYTDIKNFGDMLNEEILKQLFQVSILDAKTKKCEGVCIGSLLQCFTSRRLYLSKFIKKVVHVWGTGFIADNYKNKKFLKRKLVIHAVRGKLSLETLKHYMNEDSLQYVALGDPGLLCRYLIDSTQIEKKYTLGIIPHFLDKNNPILKNIEVENSVLLDIQQDPISFLKQLAQCRCVISSAMHGLIAADSLGIPNIRMVISDKTLDFDYKYNDYYSVFGINDHKRIFLKDKIITEKDVIDIENNYIISQQKVDEICQNLVAKFPF